MTDVMEQSTPKKILFRHNLAGSLPPVRGDVTQLRQVVMNLVANASEAIGERSGEITVTTSAIHCDKSYLDGCFLNEDLREGLYAFVEISDTGPGMDAETLGKVFDPFFSTKFAGRGLGLAALLGIVRSHKGTTRVRSEPGHGARFRVLLPALPAPSPVAKADRAAAGESEDGWRGEGLVLLVDDEELVRNVASRMLERIGFTVLAAADGLEAVQIFQERSDEIRCVLLDYSMPYMDGAETLRQLRGVRADVPVVISTGYDKARFSESSGDVELAGFIHKPFQLASLRTTMRAALGGK